MIEAGVPEAAIGFMAAFGEAIAHDELDTNRTMLPSILGRKPTALKEYLKLFYFPEGEAKYN
jgi:NAD(P)H dehydrogenase (quinone)